MAPLNLDDLNGLDSFEAIEKALKKKVQAHNSGAQADFEGLSPEQMHNLQSNFPTGKSPLVLHKLSEEQLQKCPLLQQVRFLIDKMKGGKIIKLTKTGALNTKLVKELYAQAYLKNEMIEAGITKLSKESDAMEIEITPVLLKLSGLTKKRKEKLSLTKKGEQLAADGDALLREIITALFYKLNWAYFDGYTSEEIGMVNPAYSLYLLKKFGAKRRDAKFYSEKYFKAFPMLHENGDQDFRAYETRTFNRYFYFLGIVEKESEGILDPLYVKKTAFFDTLIGLKATK